MSHGMITQRDSREDMTGNAEAGREVKASQGPGFSVARGLKACQEHGANLGHESIITHHLPSLGVPQAQQLPSYGVPQTLWRHHPQLVQKVAYDDVHSSQIPLPLASSLPPAYEIWSVLCQHIHCAAAGSQQTALVTLHMYGYMAQCSVQQNEEGLRCGELMKSSC